MEDRTDIKLQRAVLEELDWDPSVNAADIGVAVHDGIVTLTGHVTSYAERRAAEEAAQRVAGVLAVAEEIDVHMPGEVKITDAELAEAVVNAIKWHVYLPEKTLYVSVEEGAVTLKGSVEHPFQKEKAIMAVKTIKGVRSIINLIRVQPKLAPENVKVRIQRAFERSGLQHDEETIQVEVNGHEIVLRGFVRTWKDRENALRAASSAPGVASVVNEIKIRPLIIA